MFRSSMMYRMAPVSGRRLFSQSRDKTRKARRWLWRTLLAPIPLAAAYTTYLWMTPEISADEEFVYNKKIKLYCRMPFNAMSRLWGSLHQLTLPVWMRSPVFGLYIWLFNCQLDEASDENLRNYQNLSQFFRRSLKPDVRPIDTQHSLTSPADGRILYFGRVENGLLEQVKGINYTLQGFLGPIDSEKMASESSEPEINGNAAWSPAEEHHKLKMKDRIDEQLYEQSLKKHAKSADTDLFHCIIYLAPGDYHRFHSPTNWKIFFRRHFSGKLLSVNPRVAKIVEGLFSLNERVVYMGEWMYGFFSYAAVGATNVGSIHVFCDPQLKTNQKLSAISRFGYIDQRAQQAIDLHKGELFGEFNLGSTIVLVFEAPKNFEFCIQPGDKLKMGQALGSCS